MVLRRRKFYYAPLATDDEVMGAELSKVAFGSLLGACASAIIGQWCCPKTFRDNWKACSREDAGTSEEAVALRIDQMDESHAANIQLLVHAQSELKGNIDHLANDVKLEMNSLKEEIIVTKGMLEEVIAQLRFEQIK